MRQALMRLTTGHRLLVAGVLGLVAVGAVVLAGTAIAGLLVTSVPTFTGCMTNGGGTVSSLKQGNEPLKSCGPGMMQIRLSGGDITSITVGSGLTGGGTEGDISIGLNAQQTLPSCSNDQVPKWNGSSWACGADNNTTYAAGTGLELSAANAFGIAAGFRLAGKACTTAGQFARGFDSNGAIQCATPSATSLSNFDEPANDGGVPDDGAYHDFVNVKENLPGTYLLLGKGTLTSMRNVDDFTQASCALRQNGNVRDEITGHSITLNEVIDVPFSLMTVVTVASGDELQLSCIATPDADGVGLNNGRIIGIRIGN
jgi:hypothetical protein